MLKQNKRPTGQTIEHLQTFQKGRMATLLHSHRLPSRRGINNFENVGVRRRRGSQIPDESEKRIIKLR